MLATLDDTRSGLTSDGGGAYEDGLDGVQAVINDEGQLQLFASATRPVHVRVEDAGNGTSGQVLVEGDAETRMQSKRAADPGGLDLRGMAVGDSAFTALRILWDDGDLSWRLRFGRVCKEPDAGNTPVPEQMMLVIRTTADTWVMTSLVNGVERRGRLCLLDRSVKRREQRVVTISDEVSAPFTITATLR